MKILIIDDSSADRNFYKKHIEESELFNKVAIDECDSLSKAFKLFEKDKYDLIILDLGLPESDGIETVINTVAELKKNDMKTPVIVLTGLEDHLIGTEAFRHGIKDFLTKSDVKDNCKELSRSIKYATYALNFKK